MGRPWPLFREPALNGRIGFSLCVCLFFCVSGRQVDVKTNKMEVPFLFQRATMAAIGRWYHSVGVVALVRRNGAGSFFSVSLLVRFLLFFLSFFFRFTFGRGCETKDDADRNRQRWGGTTGFEFYRVFFCCFVVLCGLGCIIQRSGGVERHKKMLFGFDRIRSRRRGWFVVLDWIAIDFDWFVFFYL